MKKKIKVFSIVLLALVLIGGGYLLYLFKFKQYDVADEEIDEIMEEDYEVELPDGSIILVDENGELIEQKKEDARPSTENTEKDGEEDVSENKESSSSKETVTESKTGGTTGGKSAGTTSNKDNTVNKPTVAEIKNRYTGTFQKLEGQADAKINALVSRAKSEYNTKKTNGESISYSYFYNKYMGAANALEAQTDAVFYGTVSVVEKELENNGYGKSHAQSFVDEYKAMKKTRRDSLLKKALGR